MSVNRPIVPVFGAGLSSTQFRDRITDPLYNNDVSLAARTLLLEAFADDEPIDTYSDSVPATAKVFDRWHKTSGATYVCLTAYDQSEVDKEGQWLRKADITAQAAADAALVAVAAAASVTLSATIPDAADRLDIWMDTSTSNTIKICNETYTSGNGTAGKWTSYDLNDVYLRLDGTSTMTGNLAMGGNDITGADVVNGASIVMSAGGSFGSTVTVGNAVASGHAVNITVGDGRYLERDGTGSMTGDIVMGTNDITGAGNIATATLSTTGDAGVGGKLTVTGDLTVNGTTTTVDTEHLAVEDPLISLARLNGADSLDIGFYGKYVSSGAKYFGVFRDQTDGKVRVFHGLSEEPTTTVNVAGAGYAASTLVVGGIESSGNIAMGGNKVTGLAAGSATGEAARYDELNSHTTATGTSVHGLGTMSTQAANNVTISGGSITGITDLAVADGGTGASDASGARSSLGLGSAAVKTVGGDAGNLPEYNATANGAYNRFIVRGVNSQLYDVTNVSSVLTTDANAAPTNQTIATAFNRDFAGTGSATTVARADHIHDYVGVHGLASNSTTATGIATVTVTRSSARKVALKICCGASSGRSMWAYVADVLYVSTDGSTWQCAGTLNGTFGITPAPDDGGYNGVIGTSNAVTNTTMVMNVDHPDTSNTGTLTVVFGASDITATFTHDVAVTWGTCTILAEVT